MHLPLIALLIAAATPAPARPNDLATQEAPVSPRSTAPAEAEVDPSVFTQVPPGTPEDQGLYRTAEEMDRLIPLAKRRMAELQWTIRNERLDERLGVLAEGSAPGAAHAREVRVRLARLAGDAYAVLTRRWPVDTTRVCSYQRLSFGSAMLAKVGPEKSYYLESARTDLKQCVVTAEATLRQVNTSNQDLGAAVAEALALTGPLPAGQAPPPTPIRPPLGTPTPMPPPPPASPAADPPGGQVR